MSSNHRDAENVIAGENCEDTVIPLRNPVSRSLNGSYR